MIIDSNFKCEEKLPSMRYFLHHCAQGKKQIDLICVCFCHRFHKEGTDPVLVTGERSEWVVNSDNRRQN